MDLVIPFVERSLHPQVRQLGENLGARFVEMTEPTSYFALLEQLWVGERDFAIWEEDVVPSGELIEGMASCSGEWCGGTFGDHGKLSFRVNFLRPDEVARSRTRLDAALGCTKFSALLQRRIPDAMVRAARLIPGRFWTDLDWALIDSVLMHEEGLLPHLHYPAMQHLKPPESPPVLHGPYEDALRRVVQSRLWLETSPDTYSGVSDSRGFAMRSLNE